RTDSKKRGNGGRIAVPLKSPTSLRQVPVPRWLGEYLLKIKEYPVEGGDPNAYFIFPFLPINARDEWKRIRQSCREVRLGSLHFLRSSRLTYWAAKMPPNLVAQISGNSLRVLEKFYVRRGVLLDKEEVIEKAV
ncbi:MAG: hypothetical protein ACP5M7_10535, partial [Thermoproteota archaeon]